MFLSPEQIRPTDGYAMGYELERNLQGSILQWKAKKRPNAHVGERDYQGTVDAMQNTRERMLGPLRAHKVKVDILVVFLLIAVVSDILLKFSIVFVFVVVN